MTMLPNTIDNITEIVEHFINDPNFFDKSLNLVHINIKSIRDKLDDIELILRDLTSKYNKTIHIIALSEIWIYSNENFLYEIDEYEAFFSNRSGNRSSGCCIYVHNSLNANLVKQLEFRMSNFLMINITNYNINIACIYRYCDSDVNEYIRFNEENILSVKRTLIIGDININLKNGDSNVINYLDTIQTNGFVCLNSTESESFTRKKNSISTYIDHIISDLTQTNYRIILMDTPISDHRMIIASIKLNQQPSEIVNVNKSIKIINYKKFDENIKLIRKIASEKDFETLHNKIVQVIRDNTEIITKFKRYKTTWANKELLDLIEYRNKCSKL